MTLGTPTSSAAESFECRQSQPQQQQQKRDERPLDNKPERYGIQDVVRVLYINKTGA